ncbi:MAG: hypothetical protein Q7S44_03615 [bacterium]|nr:hypothetical protein [bacterium]
MKKYKQQYKQSFSSNRPFSFRNKEKRAKKKLYVVILLVSFLTYFLFTWFLPNFIGGLTFLNRFKSSPVPQQSVSDNATLAPPVLNIPFEATNSATIKVHGYAVPKSKVEIYIDDNLQNTTTASDDGSFTSDEIFLNLGTNNIFGKTVDDQGNKSLSSPAIHITYESEKPQLDLKEPQDNQTINGGDKKVTVSGSVDASKEITVTINSNRVIVNSGGSFSQTVNLNDGDNDIVVIATDAAGNSTQITRKVVYQSPTPTPTP